MKSHSASRPLMLQQDARRVRMMGSAVTRQWGNGTVECHSLTCPGHSEVVIVVVHRPQEVAEEPAPRGEGELLGHDGGAIEGDPDVAHGQVGGHGRVVVRGGHRALAAAAGAGRGEPLDLGVGHDAGGVAPALLRPGGDHRRADAVVGLVAQEPRPAVEREAHHYLARRNAGVDPRHDAVARREVGRPVVERRVERRGVAGARRPEPERHDVDPVEVPRDGLRRVVHPRERRVEDVVGEVDRGREQEPRRRRGATLGDDEPEVGHLHRRRREPPRDVDPVEPVAAGQRDGRGGERRAGRRVRGHGSERGVGLGHRSTRNAGGANGEQGPERAVLGLEHRGEGGEEARLVWVRGHDGGAAGGVHGERGVVEVGIEGDVERVERIERPESGVGGEVVPGAHRRRRRRWFCLSRVRRRGSRSSDRE
uniref:Uncharacterized protein n=1 Tax=Arundo donax TaxID=35708 RepID=A0A0A9G874_ARUDO